MLAPLKRRDLKMSRIRLHTFGKGWSIGFLIALFTLPLSVVAQEEAVSGSIEVRYPSAGKNFERHHEYPLALLKLALAKVKPNYTLQPSDDFMQQGRALKQLSLQQDIDVMWTMTSAERENMLRPVFIPIYRGLIGWRVFLSARPHIVSRKEALSLEALKGLASIQGHDWPDTEILRRNGFQVYDSPSYAGLFEMIALGRADLFPRSIIEVWDELEQFKNKGVGLEPYTLIRYPSASYYFVAPENKTLALAIEKGLRIALEDGSFQSLFKQHFDAVLSKTRLAERTIYQLENPLMSKDTPLVDEQLWFSAASYFEGGVAPRDE